MARATYTEADKAKVYVVLAANDGNIKRTARETGVPAGTIRGWRNEWEAEGPPSTEDVEAEAGTFLDLATGLRGDALEALRRKVKRLLEDPDKVKVAEMTTLVGVLDDKITRASGLATGRVEHVHALPPADEIRAALTEAFDAVRELTQAREAEIIDAEIVEIKALPSAEQAR